MLEIIAVPLHIGSLVDRFLRVPWFIHREYAPNKQWVPPLMLERKEFLNPKKNPFFEHAECGFWLAIKDGRDVGRIAAVIDRDYQGFHKEATGFVGMFECTDDFEIAGQLFAKARSWLKQRSVEKIIGPMDLSTHHMCGTLISSFDRSPGFNMPYNPEYYPGLWEQQGFEKEKDLFYWSLDPNAPTPERVVRISHKIAEREGIRLRSMDVSRWDEECEVVLEILNEAWAGNWGFVPLKSHEFKHLVAEMKHIVHPRLALVAEVEGRPVGFSVTIKNINSSLKKADGKLLPLGALRMLWDLKVQPKNESARLILLGIREAYRKRGLDSLFFVETHKAAAELGYQAGEIGWTLEDNEMVNRAIEKMGGTKASTYRVYRDATLNPSPEAGDSEGASA